MWVIVERNLVPITGKLAAPHQSYLAPTHAKYSQHCWLTAMMYFLSPSEYRYLFKK